MTSLRLSYKLVDPPCPLLFSRAATSPPPDKIRAPSGSRAQKENPHSGSPPPWGRVNHIRPQTGTVWASLSTLIGKVPTKVSNPNLPRGSSNPLWGWMRRMNLWGLSKNTLLSRGNLKTPKSRLFNNLISMFSMPLEFSIWTRMGI